MIMCYLYKNVLLFLLLKVNFKLYNFKLFYFITTNITDLFSVCLLLCSFVTFQCLVILTCYHFFSFIIPSLFKFEQEKLRYLIFTCFLFFVLSVILLHFFVLPLLCDFFLNFQTTCNIKIFFESKITEYFIFYREVYILTVLIGQIFAVGLLNLIIINKKVSFIKKYRKNIYLFFFLYQQF